MGEVADYITAEDTKIGTPATRTQILNSLKRSAIINLDKNQKYQLDTRGLILASAFKYYIDEDVATAIKLKQQIRRVTPKQGLKGLAKVVNSFKVLDPEVLVKVLSAEVDRVLSNQEDIEKLESY